MAGQGRRGRLQRAIDAQATTLGEAPRQRVALKSELKAQGRQEKGATRLVRLHPTLCHKRRCDIDGIDIQNFINARRQSQACNSTVNRDLATLSNAFNLVRSKFGCTGSLKPIGHITRLPEPRGRNRRLEADEETALMAH